jgi:hypothetical protein
MSLRRLRARLDRLTLLAGTMPGRRERDRIRYDELGLRKRQQQVLTDQEEDELLALKALFHEADQDHNRLMGLSMKQAIRPWVLTDEEKRELAELERRYPPKPPDPNNPFKSSMDAIKEVLAEEERKTSR